MTPAISVVSIKKSHFEELSATSYSPHQGKILIIQGWEDFSLRSK